MLRNILIIGLLFWSSMALADDAVGKGKTIDVSQVLATPAAAATFSTATPSYFDVSVDRGRSITLSGNASSVFVANPDIADIQVMSPSTVMVFGKRTGETSFMATSAKGETLAQYTIRVAQDLSGLRHDLDMAIPGNRIRIEAVPNGIVLTGDAKDAATIADAHKLAQRYLAQGGDIINRVRVLGSNQVQIRVRFAEVRKNTDNTLGIDWNTLGNIGGMSFGLFTGAQYITDAANRSLITRTNNSSLNLPNDALAFRHVGKRFDVSGMVDALAQEGLLTILAEPNLTAMSGETANFLAGGEFPILIPQGSNSNQFTVQFKTFGISLAFTPTLVNDDRINLHVKPEASELTTEGSVVIGSTTIPGLKVRRAETTVEVASGQSFAIAGLLDNNTSHVVDKYPLIGDIPVLGQLFRSDHYQSGQTELIVIITPYIVNPTSQQLALPMDGMSPPSESDRFLKLRMSGSDPSGRTMSGEPTATLSPPMVTEQGVKSGGTTIPPVSASDITQPEPSVINDAVNAAPAPVVAVKSEPVKSVATKSQPIPVKLSPTRVNSHDVGGFILE